MIRVRLTASMMGAVSFEDFSATGCRDIEDREILPDARIQGDGAQLLALARAFEKAAAVLDGVKGKGTVRRVAISASARIREAIEKSNRIALAPIPVTITFDEQDALLAIDRDALTSTIALSPRDRLYRRGLIDQDDAILPRGRAVLDGTPPGDLVPNAFFERGVRVRLAFDLVGGNPGVRQHLTAGTELEVECADGARVDLVTTIEGQRIVVAERVHGRTFFVVGRS